MQWRDVDVGSDVQRKVVQAKGHRDQAGMPLQATDRPALKENHDMANVPALCVAAAKKQRQALQMQQLKSLLFNEKNRENYVVKSTVQTNHKAAPDQAVKNGR